MSLDCLVYERYRGSSGENLFERKYGVLPPDTTVTYLFIYYSISPLLRINQEPCSPRYH